MRRLRLGMMAGGIPLDPDAQAFLNAAGITNATITTAIDTLVIQLKTIGVWTKLKAIYPFVGGTATTHKFNLKNPADTNAAFRLAFVGGWTHSVNGVQGNGVNAYADTKLNELLVLTTNNEHISIYSRTNIANNGCDMGVSDGAGSGTNIFSFLSNTFFARVHDNGAGITNTAGSLGHFISNRVGLSQVRAFQNGVLKLLNNASTNLKVNQNFTISALNFGSFGNFSIRQIALASIGDGLTDTEAANYYSAVQAFQTTLGRQV